MDQINFEFEPSLLAENEKSRNLSLARMEEVLNQSPLSTNLDEQA